MSFSDRIHAVVARTSEAASDVTQTVAKGVGAATGAAQAGTDIVTRGLGNLAGDWSDKLAMATAAGAAALSGDKPAIGKDAGTTDVGEPVELVVRLDGKPLTDVGVSRMTSRLAVNEVPSGQLELTIPTAMHDDFEQLTALLQHCAVGKSVDASAQGRAIFAGVVGGVQVELSEGRRRIRLKLKPTWQGLKVTCRSRVFEKGADQALLKQVLGEHGIKIKATEGMEGEHEQRVQWDCSDWAFVRGLMGLHGVWLWPHGDGSVTVGPPAMTGKTHVVAATSDKPGPATGGSSGKSVSATVQSLNYGFSGLNLPRQVTLAGWDVGKQTSVSKSAKKVPLGTGGLDPAAVKPLADGALANWALASPGGVDAATQQACASGQLLAQQAQAVRVQLVVEGVKPYGVRDRLTLSGFGAVLSGTGVITALEYAFEASPRSATTTVWIGLDEELAVPPLLPVPDGLMVGKVAAFKADPKKDWNRLPVTVPLLGKGTLWARWASPYASTDSGMCFYPEKDDEVVLGFLGGEPVILGAVHNPIQKAPFAPSEKNARKGVVLKKAGEVAELGFDRDKHQTVWRIGKEATPEQGVMLDVKKGVSLQSEVGDVKVEVKKGKVQWQAKTGVTMTTDEKLALQGKTGVTLKSDKDVQLAALANLKGSGKQSVRLASEEGQLTLKPTETLLQGAKTIVKGAAQATLQSVKTSVKGTASVSVEGAKASLKGTADVSVEGAKASLKGTAMAEVNSSAIVNVKGALVNLG